jgi:hypothetical protein
MIGSYLILELPMIALCYVAFYSYIVYLIRKASKPLDSDPIEVFGFILNYGRWYYFKALIYFLLIPLVMVFIVRILFL